MTTTTRTPISASTSSATRTSTPTATSTPVASHTSTAPSPRPAAALRASRSPLASAAAGFANFVLGGSAPESPRPLRGALAYDLATIRVLWLRDLVRFFRQPSRLVGALGQPVIFWLVIGSGLSATFRFPGSGVSYLSFFFPGVVLMVVLFAAIFTTLSVIEDRHRGFLQAVLAGPGSRAALVLGKTLGSASVALTQAALFVALAPAAGFAYGAIDWPLLVAALALAAVGLAGLGFVVAWLVDNVQGYHAIQMTLLVPLWVVSGAMFPPSPDHPGFAAVMRWNPVAYAVSATRRALAGADAPGALAGSAGRDLAVLALFAAVTTALAVLAARRPPRR